MHTLLILPLRSKRDVLLARQRARQLAALLQFETHEQACIAAGAFAVATQALRQSRSSEFRIHLEKARLHIFARSREDRSTARFERTQPLSPKVGSGLCLVKPLPSLAAELPAEDLAWLLGQLNRQTRLHLFDEVQRQNQEMLALLHALQSARARVQELEEHRQDATAA